MINEVPSSAYVIRVLTVIAYLVLSHVNAPQVIRLARRLAAEPDAVVFLRHDGTHHPLPIDAFFGCSNIYVEARREPVDWGTFGQVQAVLNGIETALAAGIPYDWMVLVSGQDYVCTDLAAFHRRLETCGHDGFLDHTSPDDPRLKTENADRYDFRYVPVPKNLEFINSRLWRLNRLQPFVRFSHTRNGSRIGFADRSGFADRTVYRGSFWWALTRGCTQELVDTARGEPGLVAAYQQRLHPDESFFQTVLFANPLRTFENDDLRYLRWDDPRSGSPSVLGTSHLDAILASGKPFARKFDSRVDANVLDRLDEVTGAAPPALLQPAGDALA
jgi:hypothetical protein